MFLTGPIRAFAEIVLDRAEDEARIPFKKVIGCLQRARVTIRLPELHIVSVSLAKCLFNRFNTTRSEDDYNEGMATLHEVISFCGPGDTPTRSPERETALAFAVLFSYA